jgi:hypothetical protein
MTKVKYIYNYPEQIELKKGLQNGDYAIIAKSCKVGIPYISLILNGKRKMTEAIRQEVERLTEINNQK